MNSIIERIAIISHQPTEVIDITQKLIDFHKKTKLKNGMLFAMTRHTTTALLVTEGLSCIEEDILENLDRLFPKHLDYHHHRYLPDDGCIGYNADAHLKSIYTGYFLYFPVENHVILKGSRQTLYLVELDGPSTREILFQAWGEQNE